MKNTEFTATIVPPEMETLLDQWRSEGYTVLQKLVFSHEGEDYAVKRLLEEIDEEQPWYEALETATATHGIHTIVAAKCRIIDNSL